MLLATQRMRFHLMICPICLIYFRNSYGNQRKSDSLPAAIARNAAKIRRAERLGLSFRKQDDT